jgi:hypothetical protein
MLTKVNPRSSERTYRGQSQLIGGVIALIIFDLAAIDEILRWRNRPVTVVLASLLFIGVTFIFGRMAMSKIQATVQGIRVANVFSTFELRWDEIDQFTVGRWKLLPYVCLVHIRGDGQRHAFSIQESTQRPNGSAEQMIDELNRELASRRPGGSGDDQQGRTGSGTAQSELFQHPGVDNPLS